MVAYYVNIACPKCVACVVDDQSYYEHLYQQYNVPLVQ